MLYDGYIWLFCHAITWINDLLLFNFNRNVINYYYFCLYSKTNYLKYQQNNINFVYFYIGFENYDKKLIILLYVLNKHFKVPNK